MGAVDNENRILSEQYSPCLFSLNLGKLHANTRNIDKSISDQIATPNLDYKRSSINIFQLESYTTILCMRLIFPGDEDRNL